MLNNPNKVLKTLKNGDFLLQVTCNELGIFHVIGEKKKVTNKSDEGNAITAHRKMNIEKLIEDANAELKQKGFSTVVMNDSKWDNTVTVTINTHKGNPYGATLQQAKYLESIENIGHWNESGDSCWHSHAKLQGCSKSAVSWLIGFAKTHKGIDVDLILK